MVHNLRSMTSPAGRSGVQARPERPPTHAGSYRIAAADLHSSPGPSCPVWHAWTSRLPILHWVPDNECVSSWPYIHSSERQTDISNPVHPTGC